MRRPSASMQNAVVTASEPCPIRPTVPHLNVWSPNASSSGQLPSSCCDPINLSAEQAGKLASPKGKASFQLLSTGYGENRQPLWYQKTIARPECIALILNFSTERIPEEPVTPLLLRDRIIPAD